MLNKVIIHGRMVRDPDLRSTANGISCSNFTVSVDRDFKPKDGSDRQADFIDVVCWRSKAEFVNKYFSKGSPIIVEGRLQTRTYTDKEGVKRKVTEIQADNVYFGGSKKSSEGQAGQYPSSYSQAQEASTSVDIDDYDDFESLNEGDLPF